MKDHPSLESLLPYHSFDPDGKVWVLADGSLGVAWDLGAPETEAYSESQLGELAARIESMLRLFPERSAVQLLLALRRDVRGRLERWSGATTADGLHRDLAASRVRALESLAYEHDGKVVVARALERTLTLRAFVAWDRVPAREERFFAAYAKANRGLLEPAAAVENLLTQQALPWRRLDADGLLERAFAMLNPGRAWIRRDGDGLLRGRVARSPVDADEGDLRIDALHHRLLSMIEVPRETWAGMLSAVVELVPEAVVVFNVEVCDRDSIRRILSAKKRLAFCQLSGGEDKVDVGAMKEELDRTIGELYVDGSRVLGARVHVLVRDASGDGARERARTVVNALSRIGVEAVEEDSLALTLFLQSLPLAFDPENDRVLRRGRKMLGMNLAHLLPLYGGLRGTPEPDLLFLNRQGEPVTFSLFDSDTAPHGIVAGVTGSGKSVLANHLILSAARRGSPVFVLDRGNSYRKLCGILGGAYVAFDPQAPLSLNPFGRGLTEEKKLFLTDILAEMCTQGRRELEVKERSLLTRGLLRAFDGRDDEIRVGDVVRALAADPEAHDLAVCLELFAGAGPYAGFFDRPCAVDFTRPLTVFELGDIAKRRDVASVLLMALIHQITEFCAARREIRKYLVIDEAWTLLQSATTAHFLEDVLRTYRKLNSAAVLVTQQVSDFDGRTGEAIRGNAPNRLFLRQTPETVLAMERLLDLSPEEKKLLASLQTVKGRFSEILILAPGTRGVARLAPDPLGYWVTTSDPQDNAWLAREEARLREGGDPDPLRRALQSAAIRFPHGVAWNSKD
jgi:conjugal transfer ATP-binding protein TraC